MIQRRFAGAFASVVVAATLNPSILSARDLTFEDRVAAQSAIEQVNWNHRIWPKENPQPKPPLSVVMSDDAIRAKVEDYIEKSNALERLWHRPITGEQLQAEMNRMATETHDPRLLQEIFAALADDPYVIAETLARQTLADRLIHDWYASDLRFHGDARARAMATLDACSNVDCMRSLGGEYRQTTLTRQDDPDGGAARPGDDVVRLDPDEWKEQLDALAESIPSGRLSPLEETADAFIVRAVLTQRSGAVTIASVSWPKRSFDTWWSGQRRPGSSLIGVTASFVPAAITSAPCNSNTWLSTGASPVSRRYDHTAVWTGVEMIVWGGLGDPNLNTGGRYNPSTNAWSATSVGANVPSGRRLHSAVWTGTEMIVWGGQAPGTSGTGGRYNPSTDTWTATAIGPAARIFHTAIWTGTEMIVWGGEYNGQNFSSGGRYDPSADTWTATSTGPSSRTRHTAVWTGSEMIVWGGINFYGCDDVCAKRDGSRYNPATDTWTGIPDGALGWTPRTIHNAVWTGTELIVWGGSYSYWAGTFFVSSGTRYNPATGIWTPMSQGGNSPTARNGHSLVWTGTRMIVWGGHTFAGDFNSGSLYDPLTDSWSATTAVGAPSARFSHTATWTGSEMIVWGGENNNGSSAMNSGGRYCGCLNTRTVYRDADGDGYGRATSVTTSNCDGSAPAGYADSSGDCNDGNPTVYPDAPEINDGIDNQCAGSAGFGVIDEISGLSGFMTAGDTTLFSWPPQTGASSYDVVRSTTPDFSTGCVAISSSDPLLSDPESPAAGSSFYYLVRASTPHVGSWGQRHDGTPRAGGCLTP